jgi:hypothetical protein
MNSLTLLYGIYGGNPLGAVLTHKDVDLQASLLQVYRSHSPPAVEAVCSLLQLPARVNGDNAEYFTRITIATRNQLYSVVNVRCTGGIIAQRVPFGRQSNNSAFGGRLLSPCLKAGALRRNG